MEQVPSVTRILRTFLDLPRRHQPQPPLKKTVHKMTICVRLHCLSKECQLANSGTLDKEPFGKLPRRWALNSSDVAEAEESQECMRE